MMREMRIPALGRVEIADGQPEHVRLHGAPHVGDGALRRHAENLRYAESGDGLNQGGPAGRERERHEQLGVVLVDHPVDHPLGGGGQDQPGKPVDEHSPRPTARRPRCA